MQAMEWTTVDKTEWGAGPWHGEPDKMQWEDRETGLPCLIVRNNGGALCGYVGVGMRHPDFGKGYDDVDVEVHGGLTFAGLCRDSNNEAEGICHVAPGEGTVWWLGFDCAHYGDISPAYEKYMGHVGREESYKDVAYVKMQVTQLAAQIKAREVEGARAAWTTFRNVCLAPITWARDSRFGRRLAMKVTVWRMKRALPRLKQLIAKGR